MTRHSLPVLTVAFLVALTLSPPLYAQTTPATPPPTTNTAPNTQFQRDGIFGCSRNSAQLPGSVGGFSARGGVFVPVADYTTELNTGTLVYQQCVLRGIVNREKEAVTGTMVKNDLKTFMTGKNGAPLFMQRWFPERGDRQDTDTVFFLTNLKQSSALNSAFKDTVVQAIARQYMQERRRPEVAYTCPYQGDMEEVWSGRDTSDEAIYASVDPRCSAVFAAKFAEGASNQYVARGQEELMTRLQWNNGTYDIENVDANNQHIVLTPGSFVRAVGEQAVTSGFRQTENANDVDQMVGALFAGLSTQILTSSQGLAGLLQKNGSQPSYLDQMNAESSAGLRSSLLNAALQTLAGARQVETSYLQVVNAIADKLSQTIKQLRGAETQCWALVIQHVCTTPLAADNTCKAQVGACTTDPVTRVQTCPPPIDLKVATSTAFSQPIISGQVAPLATQTVTNIQSSQKALGLIDNLIGAVSNTASIDAQRIALSQLDQLVSLRKLHTQPDLTTVQSQQQAVGDAMTTLVQNTVQSWADSTDPNVGWCNVNNPSLIDFWIQQWKI